MPTRNERGLAVVMVLLVTVVLFLMVAVLFHSGAERGAVTSEENRFKALLYAENGLALAKDRIYATGRCGPGLLEGPDRNRSADGELIGLRDLGLTSSIRFTSANEGTKSATVLRDFGDGTKKYEVLRMPGGASSRALVYVRVDHDLDEDLELATDGPPRDQDGVIAATSIAEYPVPVNGNGVEVTDGVAGRTRAMRKLQATFRLAGCGNPPCDGMRCGATVRWWEIPVEVVGAEGP